MFILAQAAVCGSTESIVTWKNPDLSSEPPFTSSATLGNLVTLSQSQFPFLVNEGDNFIIFQG